MSELKCPFCQQELKTQTMNGEWLECWNCSYHEPSHHPFPQRILCGTKELWQELIRTRKENEDKQAVLNCVVDMLKTLNQKYTLIMGKDVIKETVRLLEQKD